MVRSMKNALIQLVLWAPRLRHKSAILMIGFICLGACQSVPSYKVNASKIETYRQTSQPAPYKPANLRPYVVFGKTYTPVIPPIGTTQRGGASWYGYESPNRNTANGERFDTDIIAAAHKTWPLPSIVEVKNLDNNKILRLRLNDRGPFVDGRIIDLTREAAKQLGVYKTGTARVEITFLGPAPRIEPAIPSHTFISPGGHTGATHCIIQLGSFLDPNEASKFQKSLLNEGVKAKSLSLGSRTIIYLGPYNKHQKAQSDLRELRESGFEDAFIKSVPKD